MTDTPTKTISPSELEIGMYVYLDLGWMEHPFPINHFEIRTQAHIASIQALGLAQVRYAPAKSHLASHLPNPAPLQNKSGPAPELDPIKIAARERRQLLANQYASLKLCERQYTQALHEFKAVTDIVRSEPDVARKQAEAVVQALLVEILGDNDAVIRLLSESMGEKSAQHAVNVTVISLLLGKALALSKAEMLDLGVSALLHDIGKMELADKYRFADEYFDSNGRSTYQSHVLHSVNLASKMGVSSPALTAIAQHHENFDGSGYPTRLAGDKMTPLSRILSLVNWYDNLCNPANPAAAITPHDALAIMFAQQKKQFHLETLTAFIHMMGVYPPGSLVQLTDERYAMVISVNASRPIRPFVVIHNPEVPRDDALVINLQDEPKLNIHRSIKPAQLPRAAHDYLSPRKRMCYFFEHPNSRQSGRAA